MVDTNDLSLTICDKKTVLTVPPEFVILRGICVFLLDMSV
jgi:hypothetical protein